MFFKLIECILNFLYTIGAITFLLNLINFKLGLIFIIIII